MLVTCRLLLALSYMGDTQIEIMSVEGKVLSETETTITADYSEDIKRLPIEGTPANYTKVVSFKTQCTNPYKQ